MTHSHNIISGIPEKQYNTPFKKRMCALVQRSRSSVRRSADFRTKRKNEFFSHHALQERGFPPPPPTVSHAKVMHLIIFCPPIVVSRCVQPRAADITSQNLYITICHVYVICMYYNNVNFFSKYTPKNSANERIPKRLFRGRVFFFFDHTKTTVTIYVVYTRITAHFE